MNETMTIRDAQFQLGLIGKQIRDQIDKTCFILPVLAKQTQVGGVPIEEFQLQMRVDYEHCQTLIARRLALKRAIEESNEKTTVVIAGKEMSVKEAIERQKSDQEFNDVLMLSMEEAFCYTKSVQEEQNAETVENARELVKFLYGVDEPETDDQKKTYQEYIDAHWTKAIDPLHIEEELAGLRANCEAFWRESKAALRESAKKTIVTIEY